MCTFNSEWPFSPRSGGKDVIKRETRGPSTVFAIFYFLSWVADTWMFIILFKMALKRKKEYFLGVKNSSVKINWLSSNKRIKSHGRQTCWKRIHISYNGSLPWSAWTPGPPPGQADGTGKPAPSPAMGPSRSTLFMVLCSGVNSRQRKGQEDGTRAHGEHEALG